MAEPEQTIQVREVYIGPRPFERGEQGLFFGRDREISELLSLVVSSRSVLCYAPSGAGKTSLINAGLEPRLEEEGFEVLPSTRVRGLIPQGIDQGGVPNLYMYNVLLSLAGEEGGPPELTDRSLAEFLSTRPHLTDEEGFPAPRVLLFDQFEELLTSYPEHWPKREDFFQQVHAALEADPLLRVLFIVREDFLARIEPYMRQLKPFQQARFRLSLLGPSGALSAVTGPLHGTGRSFKEGVAAALIEELRKERVETAQGEAVEVVGEFVEPVQLQVVCRNLWISLPPDVQEISLEHVKAYGNVDQALQEFYEACLAEAKASQGANEMALRAWFEEQLITPAGTRGIVFRGARLTAGLLNPVVDFLENRHLIRGEWRAGSRWYELTHDRFIGPIRDANEAWRARRQARRNRWILFTAGALSLLLLIALVPQLLFSSPIASPSPSGDSTKVVEAQTTATVAAGEASQSKSRQLAAQALAVDDPQLALLLAVEANRQGVDTDDARRSLHKILSGLGYIDGKFLQELNPQSVSPRLVKRLENHKNWVLSVAFSPDGKQFVSGSADGTLILWDTATREPVYPPLAGSAGEVLSVAFSPDGSLIASANFNGQILLWNASSGQRFGDPIQGHRGQVFSVAFSPDGKWLASGGEDGFIRIWDLSQILEGASIRPVKVIGDGKSTVWSLAWSPGGRVLASGSSDSAVRLWETEEFKQIGPPLTGHHGFVRSVAWSPDGQILASGSAVKSTAEGEVILWNTGVILQNVKGEPKEIARPLGNNSAAVWSVAFDPTGSTLAIGQNNGTITLWDVQEEQALGKPLREHKEQVASIAFSPDGSYMVSGGLDNSVILWNVSKSTESIAFNLMHESTAASQGAAVRLWTRGDGTTPGMVLTGHNDEVLALAFSPDGSMLASAGRDNTVRLWDTNTGEQFEPPLSGPSDEVLSLAFSRGGTQLVSAGQDGNVLLWNLPARQPQGKLLMSYPGPVIKAAFSPDGSHLYLGGEDGKLVTLDLAGAFCKRMNQGLATG